MALLEEENRPSIVIRVPIEHYKRYLDKYGHNDEEMKLFSKKLKRKNSNHKKSSSSQEEESGTSDISEFENIQANKYKMVIDCSDEYPVISIASPSPVPPESDIINSDSGNFTPEDAEIIEVVQKEVSHKASQASEDMPPMAKKRMPEDAYEMSPGVMKSNLSSAATQNHLSGITLAEMNSGLPKQIITLPNLSDQSTANLNWPIASGSSMSLNCPQPNSSSRCSCSNTGRCVYSVSDTLDSINQTTSSNVSGSSNIFRPISLYPVINNQANQTNYLNRPHIGNPYSEYLKEHDPRWKLSQFLNSYNQNNNSTNLNDKNKADEIHSTAFQANQNLNGLQHLGVQNVSAFHPPSRIPAHFGPYNRPGYTGPFFSSQQILNMPPEFVQNENNYYNHIQRPNLQTPSGRPYIENSVNANNRYCPMPVQQAFPSTSNMTMSYAPNYFNEIHNLVPPNYNINAQAKKPRAAPRKKAIKKVTGNQIIDDDNCHEQSAHILETVIHAVESDNSNSNTINCDTPFYPDNGSVMIPIDYSDKGHPEKRNIKLATMEKPPVRTHILNFTQAESNGSADFERPHESTQEPAATQKYLSRPKPDTLSALRVNLTKGHSVQSLFFNAFIDCLKLNSVEFLKSMGQLITELQISYRQVTQNNSTGVNLNQKVTLEDFQKALEKKIEESKLANCTVIPIIDLIDDEDCEENIENKFEKNISAEIKVNETDYKQPNIKIVAGTNDYKRQLIKYVNPQESIENNLISDCGENSSVNTFLKTKSIMKNPHFLFHNENGKDGNTSNNKNLEPPDSTTLSCCLIYSDSVPHESGKNVKTSNTLKDCCEKYFHFNNLNYCLLNGKHKDEEMPVSENQGLVEPIELKGENQIAIPQSGGNKKSLMYDSFRQQFFQELNHFQAKVLNITSSEQTEGVGNESDKEPEYNDNSLDLETLIIIQKRIYTLKAEIIEMESS